MDTGGCRRRGRSRRSYFRSHARAYLWHIIKMRTRASLRARAPICLRRAAADGSGIYFSASLRQNSNGEFVGLSVCLPASFTSDADVHAEGGGRGRPFVLNHVQSRRSLSSLPRSARHLKQQSAVSTTICARARSRSIGVQFQPRETWRRHCAGIQSVVREEAEPFLLLASMTINLAGATVTLRKTDTAAAGRCDRTAPPRSGSSATLLSDCLSVHPSIHQLPQLHIHKKPFQDKSPLSPPWL